MWKYIIKKYKLKIEEKTSYNKDNIKINKKDQYNLNKNLKLNFIDIINKEYYEISFYINSNFTT